MASGILGSDELADFALGGIPEDDDATSVGRLEGSGGTITVIEGG